MAGGELLQAWCAAPSAARRCGRRDPHSPVSGPLAHVKPTPNSRGAGTCLNCGPRCTRAQARRSRAPLPRAYSVDIRRVPAVRGRSATPAIMPRRKQLIPVAVNSDLCCVLALTWGSQFEVYTFARLSVRAPAGPSDARRSNGLAHVCVLRNIAPFRLLCGAKYISVQLQAPRGRGLHPARFP